MTNCRDKSDEKGCKVIILEDGYNKNIPPTGKTKDERVVPADVSISITLMKVVEIEETDHSIHLPFSDQHEVERNPSDISQPKESNIS